VWVLTLVSLVSFVLAPQGSELSAARNGAIRGRVELRRVSPPAERRPGVADLGAPAGRDLPDVLRSVVYLESAPRGAFEVSDGGRAVMDQRNETFVPHVLAITTGTIVDFPNSDKFYHNVFSLSKGTRFDLGRYAAGHSKPVRFDRPGIVRVFCDIHSHMSASILVLDHPYFTIPAIDGAYELANVPPGQYTLIGWHERVGERTVMVRVEAGKTATVDLTVPVEDLR
jgi:plastocyanin